jgi:hypothetical protein
MLAGQKAVGPSLSDLRTHARCQGAMSLQGNGAHGNESYPQKLVQLVGYAIPMPGSKPGGASISSAPLATASNKPGHRYLTKSPHFSMAVSAWPQGMIGTDDVEFFGDPSMMRSE